jgi:predicted lipid-binding transport protein (Tim44 family)
MFGGLLGALLFRGPVVTPAVGLLDLLIVAGGVLLVIEFLRHYRATQAEAAAMPATSGSPTEAREVHERWTFTRLPGSPWRLCALDPA